MAYRGGSPPERGTFLLVEVYETVGKSVISVCEKVERAFWVCDLFIF